jgi:hypothetical protein
MNSSESYVNKCSNMNVENENPTKIEKYIMSMTEKEKKAYEIAKTHLNMSFDLEKSNGFKDWLDKNK